MTAGVSTALENRGVSNRSLPRLQQVLCAGVDHARAQERKKRMAVATVGIPDDSGGGKTDQADQADQADQDPSDMPQSPGMRADRHEQELSEQVAFTRLLDEMDLYTCNVPEDEDLAVATLFLFIGKTLAMYNFVEQEVVDRLAVEVEFFSFCIEVASLEDAEGVVHTPMETGAVLVPGPDGKPVYDFGAVADAKSMGTSMLECGKEFTKQANKFLSDLTLRGMPGKTLRGTLSLLRGLWKEITENLPMVLLYLGNALADYRKNGLKANPIIVGDEHWKANFDWYDGLIGRIPQLLSGNVDDPTLLNDPAYIDRNLEVAKPYSGISTVVVGLFRGLDSFFTSDPNRSAKAVKSMNAVFDEWKNRDATRASFQVAKTIAGRTRPNRAAILVWSSFYWVLRKFFQHSNRRLLAFLKDVGEFEQKHSIVVIRKYISLYKHKRIPVQMPGIPVQMPPEAAYIKGEEWKKYLQLFPRQPATSQDDLLTSLFNVGVENFKLWKTETSTLVERVEGVSSRFFTKKDFQSMGLNAKVGTGIGFATLTSAVSAVALPFISHISQYRDYISAAGQVVSVLSYLQWKTQTYYKLKELRLTLISFDRVKMVVQGGLAAADANQMDIEWKQKARRDPGYPRQNPRVTPLIDLTDNDWKIDLGKIEWSDVDMPKV